MRVRYVRNRKPAIDDDQGDHGTLLDQLLGYLIGDKSADTSAKDDVGPLRVAGANFRSVMRCHLLHRTEWFRFPIDASRLQAVHRMSLAQALRQLSEPYNIAVYPWNHENGEARLAGLHGDQELPGRYLLIPCHQGRERGNRRRLKQRRERKVSTIDLFNEMEQLSRFERVAAEIEEVVVNPDVIGPEHLLPQNRHLDIHSISRWDMNSGSRKGGSRSR